MLLTFTIPGKPTSTNSLYGNSMYGGRRINPKAQAYKNTVTRIVRESGVNLEINPMKEYIEIEYYFYLKGLVTSKGSISKTVGDDDNFRKALTDAMFKALKIDDSLICKSTSFKIPGDEDKTIVIIKTTKIANLQTIKL